MVLLECGAWQRFLKTKSVRDQDLLFDTARQINKSSILTTRNLLLQLLDPLFILRQLVSVSLCHVRHFLPMSVLQRCQLVLMLVDLAAHFLSQLLIGSKVICKIRTTLFQKYC